MGSDDEPHQEWPMREVNFDQEHDDKMTASERLLKDFGVNQD